ncbi:MAG: hypothetical protein IT260_05930 [Saprospiraceae bacterium]|nr:hypothetical protein [Saprospiraceae bacterium]
MEFEVLKDLVRTITRNKVKQIEVLGNPGEEGSRTEELYDAVGKDRFHSDDEAARYFFKSDEKDPNYRKLRNKLIRQLINTAFFIDVQKPMFSERGKAQYNCYRDYAAAFVLKTREAHKSSVYLLQQVLEQSIKFEFTDLTADICRQLRMQFSKTPSDEVNHERYSALHRLYEEKRYWEFKALDYHENLIHHYINGRSANEEVHRMASEYFEELLPKAQEVDTIQFFQYTYIIGTIKYLSANNCLKTIELCNEALNLLEHRKNSNRGYLFSLAIQKLACQIQLRQFEEADTTAQYCFDQAEEGGFNWFRLMELQFYSCTYRKQYPKALKIYEKAVQHPRYNLLSGSLRDTWTMHGGYLHLLAALGQLPTKEVTEIVGFFKPVKFQNDFESLNREKDGMNIPLVLLPIMYSIVNGNYEEDFGRSFEALEKYRQRYLDNDTNRRSAIFLKMLLALAKKSFEGSQAERKMEKEWASLQQAPAQVAGQSYAVEIIPYEDLWELLINH